MHIAISNSILSSSNSRSTPLPPPTTARYLVQDCITGEEFDTELYDIGDFEINDRVTYNNNSTPTFGKVIGIVENEDHAITITSTGVNSEVCLDNYVNFSSNLSIQSGTNIVIEFSCLPTYDFYSPNEELNYPLNYYYNLNIYYEAENDEGETYDDYFNINGIIELNTYYFDGGVNDVFHTEVDATGDTIINLSFDGGSELPVFSNTVALKEQGDDCPANYFLRSNGYAFYANFRTDC